MWPPGWLLLSSLIKYSRFLQSKNYTTRPKVCGHLHITPVCDCEHLVPKQPPLSWFESFHQMLNQLQRSAPIQTQERQWCSEIKVWLTVGVPAHPKGVWWGWGQGSVETSSVLPHQTGKTISSWSCFVHRSAVMLKQETQTVDTKLKAHYCQKQGVSPLVYCFYLNTFEGLKRSNYSLIH